MTEIPDTTVFINDAIGIDPSGCGCTDCIIHSSIPADDYDRIEEAVRQHFEEGREIINRTGGSIILFFNDCGKYDMMDVYHSAFAGETEVLAPIDPEDSMDAPWVIYVHPEDCTCQRCYEDSDRVTKVNNEEGMRKFAEKYFREGFMIENHTKETIVIGMKYGEFAFQEIPVWHENPEVTVVPYPW